jgi:hypothetical protein
VGAVVENKRAQVLLRIAESENREFGIERAGWADDVGAGANPENLAVIEQEAAVLADSFFFGQSKVKARGREVRGGFLHGGNDGRLNLTREFSSGP